MDDVGPYSCEASSKEGKDEREFYIYGRVSILTNEMGIYFIYTYGRSVWLVDRSNRSDRSYRSVGRSVGRCLAHFEYSLSVF